MTWAVAAILLGILLLGLEVFIPSGGLLMILAIFSIGAGVVLIFFTPESQGGGRTTGIITIIGLLILLPIMAGVLLYYLPYTSIGKQYFLPGPSEEEATITTEAEDAFVQLSGQLGKTLTLHQPSGAVEVQGRRYDSTTEGVFVDAGHWVRVIAVKGSQLVVRPLSDHELQELPSDLET